MSSIRDMCLSMLNLATTSIDVFESITKFEKVYIMTPEYLLREHYYKEFGHYPEWYKSVGICECCGQEICNEEY